MVLSTAARIAQDLICVRAAQPRSLRGWRARKQIVKRMVLSTIHVSQAHILEKQSRCRTAGFDGRAPMRVGCRKSTVRLFLFVGELPSRAIRGCTYFRLAVCATNHCLDSIGHQGRKCKVETVESVK